MLNIIIFGPHGSGQGTQSKRIAEKYDLIHLSTGDLLREEVKRGTNIGKQVQYYIDQGELVPDFIIMKELYIKATEHINSRGFIFDGFPRTIVQAEMLDKMLEKREIPVNIVLNIIVDEDELIKRMIGRGVDSERSDDQEDIIHKRINVYKQQTYPLINFYKHQGKLISIDGMERVDKVFKKICTAVDAYISDKTIMESM